MKPPVRYFDRGTFVTNNKRDWNLILLLAKLDILIKAFKDKDCRLLRYP